MWSDPNFESVEQRFTRRLLVLCIAAAGIGPNAGVGGHPEALSGLHHVSQTSLPRGESFAQVLETCMASIDGTILTCPRCPSAGGFSDPSAVPLTQQRRHGSLLQ